MLRRREQVLRELGDKLRAPIDAASLIAFRCLFGLLMFGAIVRTWQKGIVAHAFVEPSYFFPYYGLSWVRSPGLHGYWLYTALALLALCIAFGLQTRLAAGLFCLLFSYLHFVDVTNYLNHYYLVSLLTLLLSLVPLHEARHGSWRAVFRAEPLRSAHAPTWVLWLFRFQFGLVYFFGGVSKLKYDWLFRGEPLRTWLAANTDVPLLGRWFAHSYSAYAFSWLGALYDLSIAFALLHRRTRPFAYGAVVFFHLMTARLFQIGLFPYLMIVGSLLFLAPDWPRRLLRLAPLARSSAAFSFGPKQALPLALYALVQVLLPLRHWLYPGNVLWTEQGYRFSWNVMLIEKTGTARFTVVDRASGQRRSVSPRALLTRWQNKAMATQPDMILAFAHELARRERAEGRDVAIYADVFIVLNGRPPQRLVDPTVDLTREHEGFAPKRWLLEGPAPL
ncbi:MAG: Vitamin K-dependent gamma-carboxylase [Myxococcaceae bacterium]|nr:Vitamin K-dependent gamma-carboxylase [Myxococcaceae bacterium]